MTYPSGQTNSGPPRRCTGGGGGGGAAPLSLEGAENYDIIFVDKTTSVYVADGSVQYPYTTITAGLVAAAALLPTASKPVLVYVMPGVYDEVITLATPYVYLAGWDRDTTRLTSTIGVPITVTTAYTSVANLSIVYGAAVSLITIASGASIDVVFRDCFLSLGAGLPGNSVSFTVAGSYAKFERCQVIGTDPATSGAFALNVAAGCRLTLEDSTVYGHIESWTVSTVVARRSVLTRAYLPAGTQHSFEDCAFTQTAAGVSCLYLSGAALSVVLKGNRFISPAGVYDIVTTGGSTTGVVIENNVMTRGISPNVSHVNPVKYVGSAGHKDFYYTTQDALTACTYDDCVVKLLKDEVFTVAVTPPAGRVVTIDGNGKHSVTPSGGLPGFSLNLCAAGTTLRDLVIAGNAFAVGYVQNKCIIENTDIYGTIFSVARLHLKNVRIFHTALGVSLGAVTVSGGGEVDIVIENSYLAGSAGNFAIYWHLGPGAAGAFKIKHSTLIGGAGAASPFGRSGAQVTSVAMHHTANNLPFPAWLTNVVPPAQQFNTTDPNVDF